jgi:hypothetical protein
MPRHAPFVLDEDRKAVESFNRKAKPEHQIDVGLIPEPFLGNPEAPVVLLSLNPGWSPDDSKWHADPAFREASFANLEHKPVKYPLFLLDPRFAAPGCEYWAKKLRTVIDITGREACARHVLIVEYFPYHSKKAGNLPSTWSSQLYSFRLVKLAVRRGARVIALRGERKWTEAVPELAKSDSFSVVSSIQSAAVSPNNCGRDVHEDIVRLIRAS